MTDIKPASANSSQQLEPTRPDRPITAAEKEHALSIYDHEDKGSLWYRSSDRLKQAVDSVPEYIKTWSLQAIENKLGDKISVRDRQIRISLWREYFEAIDNSRMMSTAAITRGICDHKYLYDNLMKSNIKMAWVLYPPTNYSLAMQELLDLSVQEIRGILTAPSFDKDGNPNSKIMALKLKTHEMIENRVKGVAPKVLNINQKSLNMNVNGKVPISEKPVTALTNAQIEEELKRLQAQVKKLPQAVSEPRVVGVSSMAVEENGKGET